MKAKAAAHMSQTFLVTLIFTEMQTDLMAGKRIYHWFVAERLFISSPLLYTHRTSLFIKTVTA